MLPISPHHPFASNDRKTAAAPAVGANNSTIYQPQDGKMMNWNRYRFPIKVHVVLEQAQEQGFEHIISWLPGGKSFRIHDRAAFQQLIMPTYFPAMRAYKSFTRQLNIYGIRQQRKRQQIGQKTNSAENFSDCADHVYSHPLFLRGNKRLCYELNRVKKPRRGASQTATLHALDGQESVPGPKSGGGRACTNRNKGKSDHQQADKEDSPRTSKAIKTQKRAPPTSDDITGLPATPCRRTLDGETGTETSEFLSQTTVVPLLPSVHTTTASSRKATSRATETPACETLSLSKDIDLAACSRSIVESIIDLHGFEPLPVEFALPIASGMLLQPEKRPANIYNTTSLNRWSNQSTCRRDDDKHSQDIENEIIQTFRKST